MTWFEILQITSVLQKCFRNGIGQQSKIWSFKFQVKWYFSGSGRFLRLEDDWDIFNQLKHHLTFHLRTFFVYYFIHKFEISNSHNFREEIWFSITATQELQCGNCGNNSFIVISTGALSPISSALPWIVGMYSLFLALPGPLALARWE